MSTKANYVSEVVAKILEDGKGRELPELTDADYFPFLSSIELLLGEPTFIRQHIWETHTLEHPVSRPILDASNKADCEKKIKLTVVHGEEKDASGTTVFVGHLGSMAVDGYVLAKGRNAVYPEAALKELFKKVDAWAREWKENYGISEAADEDKS